MAGNVSGIEDMMGILTQELGRKNWYEIRHRLASEAATTVFKSHWHHTRCGCSGQRDERQRREETVMKPVRRSITIFAYDPRTGCAALRGSIPSGMRRQARCRHRWPTTDGLILFWVRRWCQILHIEVHTWTRNGGRVQYVISFLVSVAWIDHLAPVLTMLTSFGLHAVLCVHELYMTVNVPLGSDEEFCYYHLGERFRALGGGIIWYSGAHHLEPSIEAVERCYSC